MTTPVYMKEDKKGSMMEFVLPSKFNETNTSKPLSSEVELYIWMMVEYLQLLVMEDIQIPIKEKYTAELKEIISKMNLDKIGDFVYLSYDSPYKFYNRRNEVIVELNIKN